MKRRRRRRLAPLLVGCTLLTVLTVFATASLGTDHPAPGNTPMATGDDGAADATSEGPTAVDAVSRARSLRANEMGQVLVLMYHLIGHTDSKYNRTPEEFRADIADLSAAGYYPVTVRELAGGDVDVPAGKTPVVITFDDSSGGQYRLAADGTLDPDCAVAIMQEAVARGGWASRASFFPLLDVDAPDHVVFGQPEQAEEKLRQLVSWGYEVGSHTVSHLDLRRASAAEAQKQLYQSQATLEEMIGGGYQVTSLAAPFGEYPAQASILKEGEHEGRSYGYEAALRAAGGPSPSPFSASFKPYHIPRIEVTGTALADALAAFDARPGLRYVSDGDPATLAIPTDLDPALGIVRSGLEQDVVRY